MNESVWNTYNERSVIQTNSRPGQRCQISNTSEHTRQLSNSLQSLFQLAG